MKTRKVTPDDLTLHPHPASKLWRSIELKTVYEMTKGDIFHGPSLDLGGGDGYLSHLLFDTPFSFNVDNDEAGEVSAAAASGRYKKVLKEGAEHMSLKDESLRFVFSNSVIEHIPDVEAVLSEVARTLKKDGVFLFTSPSDQFKNHLYISSKLRAWGMPGAAHHYAMLRNAMLNHYHTYSHRTWKKLLGKYGLKLVKYAYYIDPQTCMMWDKIALQTRLLRIVDKQSEHRMWKKYQSSINALYTKANSSKKAGASVAIYAVKI